MLLVVALFFLRAALAIQGPRMVILTLAAKWKPLTTPFPVTEQVPSQLRVPIHEGEGDDLKRPPLESRPEGEVSFTLVTD